MACWALMVYSGVMSENWLEMMKAAAADQQQLCVFPSEIVARQWRIYLANEGLALDARRWISWDTCKQWIVQREETSLMDGAPANTRIRLLAADFLLQSLSLNHLLPAEASAGVFRRFLAGLLPQALLLVENDRLSEALGADTADEMRLLATEYGTLLTRWGYFEPSVEDGILDTRGWKVLIFGSELLEDFPRYADRLGECADIHLLPLRGIRGEAGGELEWHETVRGEVRQAIRRMRELLVADVPLCDIAITLVDHETVYSHLLREARLQGVPLDPRFGTPLSDAPGAAIFRMLGDLSVSGMAYESVRDFALSGVIPFKRATLMQALAGFGRLWRCWGCFGKLDLWADAFSRAGLNGCVDEFGPEGSFWRDYPGCDLEGLKSAYLSLKKAAAELAGAKTAKQLLTRFYEWYGQWIVADAWDENSEKEFQRCMELLNELVQLEERLGFFASSPYQVFMEMVSQTVYVQRQSEGTRSGAGIVVYPYRVSAGGKVKYSFVLNMHQEGVECLQGGLSFLRDDQQEKLGVQARDMTEAFLEASAAGGDIVWLSGNAGIGGEVHGMPLKWAVDEHFVMAEFIPGDEQLERDWWLAFVNGAGEDVPRLNQAMLDGVPKFMLGRVSQGAYNFTRQGFSVLKDGAANAEAVRDRLKAELTSRYGEQGMWRCSAHSLQSMTLNPAGLLMERIFGLKDADWEPSWENWMDVGSMYHKTLEMVFDPGRGPEDGGLSSETDLSDEVSNRELLGSLAERLRRGMLRTHSRLSLLEIDYEIALMLDTLAPMIVLLDPGHDGAEIEAVEQAVRVEDPEFELLWDGRIDRVDRVLADGSVIIWDYKRSGVPENNSLEPRKIDASDPYAIINSPQMAVYLRMATLQKQEIHGVRYVGLLKNEDKLEKRIKHVIPSSRLKAYNAEGFDELFAALKLQAREYRRRLDEMDFSIDPGRTRYRNASGFRQVLRHRYRVR
ncbi:MAG: hypothetical protein D6B26_06610 [Spirochaetaceae bacterium]|nr:MAG: hypothetical protein D6B26_06610 [Spirochaetaceae bacterium]